MVINENRKDAQAQNKKAAAQAALQALGKSGAQDLADNRAMSEYYAELFSYAPAILSEAMKNGEPYERFKLAIKFAFSIIHCMQMQDVASKKPIIPIAGETYEGLYVMPDGNVDIFMESDYVGAPSRHSKTPERTITDLITGEERQVVRKDQETTYLHIDGPKSKYQIYGDLTYHQSWRGNNMFISLLGTLNVKFSDIEGKDQTIKVQLPDYVLANFIQEEGKPRVALIDGNMTLVDETN